MDFDIKQILVAVDPSENARRAVSYVAQMIGGGSGFHVTLLHVVRPPDRDIFPDAGAWQAQVSESRKEMERFMAEARAILASGGFSAEAVSELWEECRGTGVSRDVLRVQQEGGFGTVVVGRRGVSKAEEFMFGSVSNTIVHYAKNATVWVVE